MGEGWETRRRRAAGNEWLAVRFAGQAVVSLVEVDTSGYIGNSPGAAEVRGYTGGGPGGGTAGGGGAGEGGGGGRAGRRRGVGRSVVVGPAAPPDRAAAGHAAPVPGLADSVRACPARRAARRRGGPAAPVRIADRRGAGPGARMLGADGALTSLRIPGLRILSPPCKNLTDRTKNCTVG